MENSVHEWLWQCNLPDNTELQEHTLKTDRSIVIGERCNIDYGLQGEDVIVCEFSSINGNIRAGGDIRIDNWCVIKGDVYTESDAYLGEGVKILGRLIVKGDLDIGDNVQIEKGFEAKGWISIRNPMPVVAYIILYLITLLGIEKENEINSVMQNLFGYDDEEDESGQIIVPLMIPAHSVLNMDFFSVPKGISIGSDCRLYGNIRAGSISIQENNTIFGSMRAENSVSICKGSVVHGDVVAGGDVDVTQNVHIMGDIHCRNLSIHEDARLDGTIKAPGGVKIVRDS